MLGRSAKGWCGGFFGCIMPTSHPRSGFHARHRHSRRHPHRRHPAGPAGLLVTPGWVDVHPHYDGQAMWDPLLAPSCWHGVTTVMFGNCGVGFAPVKKEHRGALMDLMEGVEEIPNPVLAAGLNWEWESFPDFMDALERRPRAIDMAAPAAHLPMRVYVMGGRAVRREA